MTQLFERLFYEVRPFVYLGGAFTANSFYSSMVMKTSVILLSLCMGMVLYWRFQYRVLKVRK